MNSGYNRMTWTARWAASTLLLICFILSSYGQKITVTNFYLAESDLTAQGRETAVIDQNNEKCALIRVQTTQKGFTFDVGSLGVQKVDDNHTGEIWVYVPHGVRHISIRHQQLGSLSNYNFPINFQKARTYIMEITTDKVFVNNYDDSRKQKLHVKIVPATATLTLNGMSVSLDANGEVEQELSFGTYTYKVEAEGYYPREGQITIDNPDQIQTLSVKDLKPILGKITVHATPMAANISMDGKAVGQSAISAMDWQIGTHVVTVSAQGYRTEKRIVTIQENQTTELSVELTQVATYQISSSPSGAKVSIDSITVGTTPCSTELATGTYLVRATKAGYKDYEKRMSLNSASPSIKLSLKKIYNASRALYFEGNVQAGTFVAVGGTLGAYINRINLEVAYLTGTEKSETIYWTPNGEQPQSMTYSPKTVVSGKVGYGIAIGTRWRLTPQVGVHFVKLAESVDTNYYNSIADGANVVSGLASMRLSVALIEHLAVSVTPTYTFAIRQSEGYEVLSSISSKIGQWKDGFQVKIGITAFFSL